MKLRITPTIANEYDVRGVFGGYGEWPAIPDGAGTFDLPLATVQAVLNDAEFQTCPEGPFGDEITREDIGIRNAYLALARQCRAAIAKAKGI